MSLRKYVSIIATTIISVGSAQASDTWKEIAKGVYQTTDPDGSTTTMAYGTDGADYDRLKLQRVANGLRSKLSIDGASADDARALADTLRAIEGIPSKAQAQITPMTSTNGGICSGYNYRFDSQLVTGQIGATAVARGIAYIPPFAPMPPGPTSSVTYVSATITPHTGSNVTSSNSINSMQQPVGTSINWNMDGTGLSGGYTVGSNSCTASTFSYISLTGGLCGSTGGYVSQSKSYTSCVTSP